MKTLSIVIPVYNEGARIQATLDSLASFVVPSGVRLSEIIFVSDGSTDETVSRITSFAPVLEKSLGVKVRVVSYRVNCGRGFAVRLGLSHVSSDYGMFIDGDISIPLSNIASFTPYLSLGYDLLIGSKKKLGAVCVPGRGFIRSVVGLGHSLLANLIFTQFVWDYQGGFKIFSASFMESVVSSCRINRWGFDMEVIFWAKKLGFKFVELPVFWSSKEGSKVRLVRDILQALWDMVYIRFSWLGFKIKSFSLNFAARLTNLL